MYENVTDKKELVVKICESLNTHGLSDTDVFGRNTAYSLDSQFGESLSYMPIENLRKILNCNVTDWSSFSKVYNAWGRAGALRFVPFLSDKNDHNPTLTIRHDRHLHLFRDMHYQVSGTPNGRGQCETGSYRISFLLHRIHNSQLYTQSLLVNMLSYAAVIDAAFVFDNFRSWFIEFPEERDNFIHKSMSAHRLDLSYTWDDIRKHIHMEDEWESVDRRLYKITCNKGILCEFAFGTETIQVRASVENVPIRILTLDVPDALEGVTNLKRYEDWDTAEFVEDVTLPSGNGERVDIKMLLIMMLALQGVRINWMGSYTFMKLGIINGTNRPKIKEVDNLNDIADDDPDEF